jgi:hypothetical protein
MVLIQGNEKIMENCKFYPNFKIQRLACHMQISTMSPRMHLTIGRCQNQGSSWPLAAEQFSAKNFCAAEQIPKNFHVFHQYRYWYLINHPTMTPTSLPYG